MQTLTISRIDFNTLANISSKAIIREELATFLDDSTERAYTKCTRYLNALPAVRLYIGWDNEIYPKFIVEKKPII